MNEEQRHQLAGGLHDLAAPYALDALDPGERDAFEAHLQSCPDCRAEVDELREAAVGLSEGLELEPPVDLRRRVLQHVGAEAASTGGAPGGARRAEQLSARTSSQRRRDRAGTPGGRPGHRWWLAAAAAVVVGAGAWGAAELLGQDDPATRIVQAQDAKPYQAQTPQGALTVIASADEDAAVLRMPAEMTPPPQGQVYQAWYVGADGSVRSAGLLTPESLEEREAVLQGTLAGAAAVGLTVEPEGGSDQPTSEPFAVVALSTGS